VFAIVQLVLTVILSVLRTARQWRLHRLDAERAALQQRALLAEQETLRQRIEYEIALTRVECEASIADVRSRRELRLKRCEARHAVEGKTPEEVRRFLREEGVF